MANSSYSFEACKQAIETTQSGRERNMYATIKEILVNSLRHRSENVLIDTTSTDGQGSPDLCIRAPLGFTLGEDSSAAARRTNRDLAWADWAVFEVKDEFGAFHDEQSREAIFMEKAKYIGVFTQWFVMIDPQMIVARPVTMRSQLEFNPNYDIVIEWAGLTEAEFQKKLQLLHAENAGVTRALSDFRQGNESHIAVVKLRVNGQEQLTPAQTRRLTLAQSDFYEAVSKSTQMLHHACKVALEAQALGVLAIQQEFEQFSQDWGGCSLEFSPFRLNGEKIEGPKEAIKHDAQVATLRAKWLKNPPLAKLALKWLPAFHERMGKRDKDHHFAIETANLILARILLIRFFEDHDFFDGKKYVCNGGVKALQEYMRYYNKGYGLVLKQAYEKSHAIYASVFDEMDLDWVLGVENEQLSRSLEIAMMMLSRFDFKTVKGDILTGIYDRFLDPKQRKEMGEFYTPPSIARYMVRHLGLVAGDKVIDPACGSGTFVLEAYQHMVGNSADSGIATQQEMTDTLANLFACDLNPFSATIAQVQMLWHLLPHRDTFFTSHFPDIRIVDRQNSLRETAIDQGHSWYDEMNKPIHKAVIGNPPYVRPERNTQILHGRDAQFFVSSIGSADKNLFSLFIYKGLKGWCRPQGKDESGNFVEAGYLAFVVPLSFCDNKDNTALRRMFQLGGQFRLVEIVDMEVIAPYVFDAAVNPIVLIAQNRPAQRTDKMTLRLADKRCMLDQKSRLFDLDQSSKNEFNYADVWTAEGNILTRLTDESLPILRKLASFPKLERVAQKFWTGKRGASIVAWQIEEPSGLNAANQANGIQWEQQEMIRMGCAFRGKPPHATNPANAFDFYKGENISAGVIEGSVQIAGIDIDGIDDSALWRYRDILPKQGFAFLQISLGLTCAPFNPLKEAFLNTATLFFPTSSLAHFPFDLLMLSRIYQYYYALALRQGAVSKLWSHLYPRNLRQLPWSDALIEHGEAIEALRADYLRLCQAVHSRRAALLHALQVLGREPWKAAVRRQNDVRLVFSEAFNRNQDVFIGACTLSEVSAGVWRIAFHDDLFSYVEIHSPQHGLKLAETLHSVLHVWQGESLTHDQLLELEVPLPDLDAAWRQAVEAHDAGSSQQALEAVFDTIDQRVGAAFGLTDQEIQTIQKSMQEDAFLRHIRPNLPFAGRTQRGLSVSLASSSRYASVEDSA